MMGGGMIKTGAVVDLLKSGSVLMERESDGAVLVVDKYEYLTDNLDGPERRYHLTIHVQVVAGGRLAFAKGFHSQSSDAAALKEVTYTQAARCIIEQIRAGFEICAGGEYPAQSGAPAQIATGGESR